MAYAISDRPLTFGLEEGPDESWVQIHGDVEGVSRKHCSVMRKGEDVVLVNHSSDGTFVDEAKISGTTLLKLGQTIRMGTPGEELKIIACLETSK